MIRIPNIRNLWRIWLRHESPRRWVLPWSTAHKTSLVIACLCVAIISSWQLLIEPDLKPGVIAPFDAVAPKNAEVDDSEALKQKRSDLISRTIVQVIDNQESIKLKKKLKRQLGELELVANSKYAERVGPVNLNKKERIWLSVRSQQERFKWEGIIDSAAERILNQGLIKTLDIDQLTKASSLNLFELGEENIPSRTLGSKLLANTFYGNSNIKIDPNKSQKLIEELITKQRIPKIEVNKGDLITKKGEPISPQAYDVLDHFGLINSSPRPVAWFIRLTEALASCGVLLLIMRRERPRLQARHGLLALALLLITQLSHLWFKNSLSPLAVIVPPTLLISQGLGSTSALAWMSVSSLLWPIPSSGIGEEKVMIACAAAAFVALLGSRMRSRAQLLQMAVLLPIGALISEWFLLSKQTDIQNKVFSDFSPQSQELVSEAIIMGSMLLLTIILIPILESTFGLITRARLMELADQERPLLRRLSSEAPGTFEHTLLICSLAEEGARTIGADVDLIRTGALYHDIGKLIAPDWFIENQTKGVNPHDQLNDPYASAEVLQAHVDEGLKLAKRHRLPKPIIDFIPEHQGTLKMGYFLHKAKEIDSKVEESCFRYKGPVPRSRETAILMLADGSEAALRALDPKTTDKEACLTVRKIVNSRQIDGQLKESSLNRAEIELIVRAFVRVWRRMRHRRIAYPVQSTKSN